MLVGSLLVEVQWRRPVVSNGNISNYIVYAIPLTPLGEESAEQIRKVYRIQLIFDSQGFGPCRHARGYALNLCLYLYYRYSLVQLMLVTSH